MGSSWLQVDQEKQILMTTKMKKLQQKTQRYTNDIATKVNNWFEVWGNKKQTRDMLDLFDIWLAKSVTTFCKQSQNALR